MNPIVEKIKDKYARTHVVTVKELNFVLEYLRTIENENKELKAKLAQAEKQAQERAA